MYVYIYMSTFQSILFEKSKYTKAESDAFIWKIFISSNKIFK